MFIYLDSFVGSEIVFLVYKKYIMQIPQFEKKKFNNSIYERC